MQIRQENALEEVANYYLDTDHLPTLSYEAKKQASMLFVSVSGAGLYVVIANNYVERMKALHGDQIAPAIHYILGNCISGLAVLYNSTDIFISARKSEVIPNQLSSLLKSPFLSDWQRQCRDAGIVFFSALSSLPLATITISYHADWMSPAMVWTQAAVTEFDNTLMHFLPIYLALQNPAFRFPVLPFEYAYQYYCKRESLEDKATLRRGQAYQMLKQKLINQLSRAQKRIILDKVSFNPRQLTYKVDLGDCLASVFTREVPDDLKQKESTGMVLGKLTAITQYGNALEEKDHLSSSAHSIVYVVGASWVTLSCIGYLLQPIRAISDLTGSQTEGLLLGLPPLYFLCVTGNL